MFSNFIADRESSEEYGVVCVRFDTISGAEIVSGEGETELNISKTPRSNKFKILSQEYTKPLSFTFQIINDDGSNIDEVKERSIKKWLCKRGKFIKFQMDDDRFYDTEFEVNISNPQIIKVINVVGMEFTVTCNAPYGYSSMIKKSYNIVSTNQQIKLYINNDIDDYIYPNITILANAPGSLSITNSTEVSNSVFTINNLVAGETITIEGEIPFISSSTSHDVWKDFNKRWIRFVDGLNTLTFSNLCTVTISYREPRRVGV